MKQLSHEDYVDRRLNSQCSNFRFMNFLAMTYMTFLMASTVMGYKVVNIWGVSEPGSTLIYTFTFFLSNVYAELYGATYAKKLILQSIICGYLFAFLISFVNYLPSPIYWNLKQEFNAVLGHVLRFTNAGVVGYLISAFMNIYLLTKWKHKLNGKLFWVRSLLATSISEGIATFVAGLLTFIGMMPTMHILHVMLNALLFKLIYGLIAVWPATFIAYFLKKKEQEVTSEKSALNFVGFMLQKHS